MKAEDIYVQPTPSLALDDELISIFWNALGGSRQAKRNVIKEMEGVDKGKQMMSKTSVRDNNKGKVGERTSG